MKYKTAFIIIFLFSIYVYTGCSSNASDNSVENSLSPGTSATTSTNSNMPERTSPEEANQNTVSSQNVDNTEEYASGIKTDTGTFSGAIDSNFIEIKISGVPDEKAAKAFMLSENIKEDFKTDGFEPGNTVKFIYILNQHNQPVILKIEKLNSQSIRREENNRKTKAYLRPGSDYFIYPEAQPTLLSAAVSLKQGKEIKILKTDGDWVNIEQEKLTGWIPKWYISSDDSTPTKPVSSKPKVLTKNTEGRLYPDGAGIKLLEKGRLLTPVMQWNDWYQVKIIVYDIPAVQYAWIPMKNLAEVGKALCIEGYLKAGTPVHEVPEFDEVSASPAKAIGYTMPVYISNEREGFIRVNAAGGWSAWTKKENLVFDAD
ncbi:MAG: hypothetical protein N3I35_01635 [Clostridia bacterium]|nr:hypothetical protein [Clostridia bacterium]